MLRIPKSSDPSHYVESQPSHVNLRRLTGAFLKFFSILILSVSRFTNPFVNVFRYRCNMDCIFGK